MNTHAATYELQKRSMSTVVGGSLVEAVTGLGAVALVVLIMFNVVPVTLLPVASIALGISLMYEGAGVSNRFLKFLGELSARRFDISNLYAGSSIESLGGIVGITLGILALLGINPGTLMPVSAIVYGIAMILGGAVTTNLNSQMLRWSVEDEPLRQMTGSLIAVSSDIELLVGLGVITLGILALMDVNPLILTAVAFLAVGLSGSLKSAAVGGNAMKVFRGREEKEQAART